MIKVLWGCGYQCGMRMASCSVSVAQSTLHWPVERIWFLRCSFVRACALQVKHLSPEQKQFVTQLASPNELDVKELSLSWAQKKYMIHTLPNCHASFMSLCDLFLFFAPCPECKQFLHRFWNVARFIHFACNLARSAECSTLPWTENSKVEASLEPIIIFCSFKKMICYLIQICVDVHAF